MKSFQYYEARLIKCSCCFLQMEDGGFVEPSPVQTKKYRPVGRVVDQPLLHALHCGECNPLTDAAGGDEGRQHVVVHVAVCAHHPFTLSLKVY